ncbi:MAG: ankyrin repeat domain-containing protein [Candidatus Accumulibacter sp.]|uniref:ankyrin repeat domain-containing protein n=1 Tax=Accumulibacter sp. TaxID=2053492 RepID=UPI00287AA93B|nr:ankyrin repeat domain-containing protein [Accumulibacter sp.]MDS4013008.1 ankyrin repeat domain-containing protein [Accumulibacter sp.]
MGERWTVARPSGLSRRLTGWLWAACYWLILATATQAATPDPTTFGLAVERGDRRTVERWLDEGLDPEFEAAQIGSGLLVAAWYGRIEMLALFVERGADVRRSNRNGEQALQLAAWNGHRAAVEWLLAHAAPLDRAGNEWSALHYAVFNGHQHIVDDLLARGAKVNARAPNGSTPLMMAAREGREELAKRLLEAGADSRLESDWGDSALTMAMRYGHYRLAKMISSPEDFAIAVKSPPEAFGEASRSLAAPSEIDDLLAQIRSAEAAGRSSGELRKKLLATVGAWRSAGTPAPRPAARSGAPRAMVITARRSQPGGERAQLIFDDPVSPRTAGVGRDAASLPAPSVAVPASAAGGAGRAGVGQNVAVADLLRQIRLAEAQGKPSDALREQFYRAVDALPR